MKQLTCTILLFFLLFIPHTARASSQHYLDQFIIANPRPTKNIFPLVDFTHKKHYVNYKIPCLTCHHEWDNKEDYNPSKCIKCHKTDRTSSNKKFILLRNAFHRSCKDCHIALSNKNSPTGPTKCKECHVENMIKNEDQPDILYRILVNSDDMSDTVIEFLKNNETAIIRKQESEKGKYYIYYPGEYFFDKNMTSLKIVDKDTTFLSNLLASSD